MDPKVIKAVADSSPRYNDYLLRGFMTEQINFSAEFIGTVFREAVKLFEGMITYQGFRVVPPEERANIVLQQENGCPVTVSELILVEYEFLYEDNKLSTLLYIPYLFNDVITIEDTQYVLQRSIKEQVFSRTSSGITMKVIRQPIPFYRNVVFRLESASDDWYRNEYIPTTSIHREKSRQKRYVEATLIHYLLCKFGFRKTIQRFNLTEDDCSFVTEIGGANDIEIYRYFVAKKLDGPRLSAKRQRQKRMADLYLRVRKDKLDDPMCSRFVASILYTLSAFPKQKMEDLYNDNGDVFRTLLGKITFNPNVGDIQGKKKADGHIKSLDTYLDPLTQNRLADYGIVVGDIYDVLQYVFYEIDKIIPNTSPSNLYNSRIDVLEELLVETIVKPIYHRWYNASKDLKKIGLTEVKGILRFPRDLIGKLSGSRIVQKNPAIHGDNALVHLLIQKIRQSGRSAGTTIINSPDHRFHPSMAVVETLVSFSKSNPGAGGAINPYLQIRPNGSVIRPDYADEVDSLLDYIPYQ